MRRLYLLAAALMLAAFNPVAALATTIEVIPYLGPASSSPNWLSFRFAAINGMQNGSDQGGDPASAWFASPTPNVTASDIVSTSGFNAWRGTAGPAGAFVNENGNALHFGVKVTAGASQVSLSQLNVAAISNDATYPLTLNFTGSLAGFYSATNWIGVLKGADTQLGTLDDVLVMSGSATTLVDAIYGITPARSILATCIGCSLEDQQLAIDSVAGSFLGTSYGARASISDAGAPMGEWVGEGQFTISTATAAVPEPQSWAMLIAGFALTGAAMRRKRFVAA